MRALEGLEHGWYFRATAAGANRRRGGMVASEASNPVPSSPAQRATSCVEMKKGTRRCLSCFEALSAVELSSFLSSFLGFLGFLSSLSRSSFLLFSFRGSGRSSSRSSFSRGSSRSGRSLGERNSSESRCDQGGQQFAHFQILYRVGFLRGSHCCELEPITKTLSGRLTQKVTKTQTGAPLLALIFRDEVLFLAQPAIVASF